MAEGDSIFRQIFIALVPYLFLGAMAILAFYSLGNWFDSINPFGTNKGEEDGQSCDLPTDCKSNLRGRGGNCCNKKCVPKSYLINGWCPVGQDGAACVVPTDCASNLNGSGGNCCRGKCVPASAMRKDWLGILWCK